MATLIKKFRGVPRGEIYPRWFAVGEVVPAELESAARAVGAVARTPKYSADALDSDTPAPAKTKKGG